MHLTSFGSVTRGLMAITRRSALFSNIFIELMVRTEIPWALSRCFCGADPCCSLHCDWWCSQNDWDGICNSKTYRGYRTIVRRGLASIYTLFQLLIAWKSLGRTSINAHSNQHPHHWNDFGSKGQNVPLPKTLNLSTGKISTQQTGFNNATWGDSTSTFVRLISKAFAHKEHKFEEIIASTKEFSKKSRRPDNSADGTPAGGEEDEELNKCALLEDISSSECGSEAGSVEV
jgi:hypothetical protein